MVKPAAKSLTPSLCPICGEASLKYQFTIHDFTVVSCPGCGLVSKRDKKTPEGYPAIPQVKDHRLSTSGFLETDSVTELDAAKGYQKLLLAQGFDPQGKLLLITPPDHVLIAECEKSGWHVEPHETLESIESKSDNPEFDAAVILYQLEKSLHPAEFLKKVNSALKPDGILMVISPSLDSTSAHFFANSWTEWRPENQFYFNQTTIQLLLWKAGFSGLRIQKDRRIYTLAHIFDRARGYPRSWITRTIKFLYPLTPQGLRHLRLRLPTSGIIVTGRKDHLSGFQTCSFILPAYNEHLTFPILMEALLEKQLPFGLHKEIVIVESNSQDGTRQQVMQYQNHPEVKIILQEKAHGKGNAVRQGFGEASGDIFIIQDADLEYDLNDIDELLEPVANYKIPFVLGARHGGKIKMRQFTDQQGLSATLNFGHIFFTLLLNLLYGQRLKDPFTMYKVFRKDCIHGLKFDSNRFDFDFELVIKLARKGYRAREITINYQSRSFKEGKKIRIFRDPLTWIWALIKYRFVNIYQSDKG